MKENKYIDENSNVIEDFKPSNRVKNDHPFVVFESEPQFRIVKEFTDDAKGASNLSSAYQQDVKEDEMKEEFIYAEEVVEDNDDLYDEELHDRAVEKQRHRTYLEIGQELDATLLKNGLSGEIGFNLLTAMKYSRLLYFSNRENLKEVVRTIAGSLGTPCFELFSSKEENDGSVDKLYEIIAFAKKNILKPIFIYAGVQKPDTIMNKLRPLYGYIDNPDGEVFVNIGGHSMIVPNNIYVIYTTENEKVYFDVPRRLLRYSARVEGETVLTTNNGNGLATIILSLEELKASFREANENFAVEEGNWRKIDNLVQKINEVNGFNIKNKTQRRLEDYINILLSTGKKQEDAIDIALANNVISEAIITQKPIKYLEEVDLIEAIDASFGVTEMKKTKAVISSYLALFDKKGEKLND